MTAPMREPGVQRHWSRSRISARSYDYVVEREHLGRVFGTIMSTDVGRLYRDIAQLRETPEGTAVLDVPCGGGVAFRGVPPDREIRYTAVDLSPLMLRRAGAEATRRGLHRIEFVQASVTDMPFEAGTFDLCVSYNGLHCFPDPPAALREMARMLRPGAELRGTAVVTDSGLRARILIATMKWANVFGTVGDSALLRTWLTEAGFEHVEVDVRGAFAYFNARRQATLD